MKRYAVIKDKFGNITIERTHDSILDISHNSNCLGIFTHYEDAKAAAVAISAEMASTYKKHERILRRVL